MASHDHGCSGHSHGTGTHLDDASRAILERGFAELMEMVKSLRFGTTPSERVPLPLSLAVYESVPDPEEVRRDVRSHMHEDPVSVLEYALPLLELYESNQGDIADYIKQDGPFTGTCFGSKRRNGWIAVMGDADRAEVEAAVNKRWQFNFYNGPMRPTSIYVLLNMLARYGYVYGRIAHGDFHALSHFVEDFTPGVIVVKGRMSDLELMLSLAALKTGVPAVVPSDYPFPLGRIIRADSIEDIAEAVTGFANIRKLLVTPEVPQLPKYCGQEHAEEKFETARVWGGTPESFYLFRRGKVTKPGSVTVFGRPGRGSVAAMGVVVTADARPLDAFDRRYIEREIVNALPLVSGVKAEYEGRSLKLALRDGARIPAKRIGEVLVAAVRRDWPKIKRVSAEVIFDPRELAKRQAAVQKDKAAREKEIASATEESVSHIHTCVGCSPFAPDHVCILTPERTPQCSRDYGQIKTGALYAYDDMTNIHHRTLHRDINSFGTIKLGRCIDPLRGEWAGINAAAAKLTGGRTKRIQLHCLDNCPTTGCGCFGIIMFKLKGPKRGIGVMDQTFKGRSPDGRSWRDLHYALAGKQTPGLSGCSDEYLLSPKFLKAHGGWKSVVWVSPQVAEVMGERLPKGVQIG